MEQTARFLPATDLAEARRIAERLREEIASTFAPTILGDIQITIASSSPEHADEPVTNFGRCFDES